MMRMMLGFWIGACANAGDDPTSEVALAAGDTMTIFDLWIAMLVSSSNQAAVALADNSGLSRTEFVQKMNTKSAELGLIKTKFSSLLWDGKEDQVANDMKVNRLGEVIDIANVVGFLASEQASYINGETIVVAGKTSARL